MRLRREDTLENVEGQEDAKDVNGTKIAIPCVGQASLQARVSSHFGQCDSYAIVTVEEGEIKGVEQMLNGGHSDCASPVRALAEKGVRVMLVGGMGMRPYLVFKELGIDVRCGITGTIAEAVDSYLKGETVAMTQDGLCGQHTNMNGSCHQE